MPLRLLEQASYGHAEGLRDLGEIDHGDVGPYENTIELLMSMQSAPPSKQPSAPTPASRQPSPRSSVSLPQAADRLAAHMVANLKAAHQKSRKTT